MEETHEDHEAPDEYGDARIRSGHAPIALWLKIVYITLPIWGVISWYVYWNGSTGFFDRGYWHQLQKAANTVYPYDEQQKLEAKDHD